MGHIILGFWIKMNAMSYAGGCAGAGILLSCS